MNRERGRGEGRAFPLLLPLLLFAGACSASPLRGDYAGGGETPFARRAIAGESAIPIAAHPEPVRAGEDQVIEKVRNQLDALARTFRERAKRGPSDPKRLGFDVERDVSNERLQQDLTLAVVLGAAFEMSPAIQSARDAFRATVEQFSQVAFLDTILRQYVSFTKDLNLRVGKPRQKETVESLFPFPGTLALKSRIVEEEAKAAEEHLQATVRRTLVSAGKTYYDYGYAQEAIGIVEENIQVLRGMVEIAESRYGVGETKQGVVLKTHTEIATLEEKLVTLKQEVQTARARLASVLGLPPDFPLGPAQVPEPSAPPSAVEPLYDLARRSRQEILALDAKIARTEALIELSETQTYPDLSLGYSRFEEGTGTRVGGARMTEPFAEKPTQMPKPWFGQSASFIEEMKGRLRAMQASRADLVATVAYQVKDAWFKWDAAWRQTALYHSTLLPSAEQTYEVLQSGWQEGVVDFLDALDAQRVWLKVRLQEKAVIRDTLAGRLALLDALGTGLPPETPNSH